MVCRSLPQIDASSVLISTSPSPGAFTGASSHAMRPISTSRPARIVSLIATIKSRRPEPPLDAVPRHLARQLVAAVELDVADLVTGVVEARRDPPAALIDGQDRVLG